MKHRFMIVYPNLGQPLFLNFDPNLKEKELQAELLIISDILDPNKFETQIKDHIKLLPVFDYMWRLRKLYDKIKKEQAIVDKKISFWARRKKKKATLKKTKVFNEEIKEKGIDIDFKSDDIDYKLKKLRVHPYRGKPIFPPVIKVKQVYPIPITDPSYLDSFYPQDYLRKYEVFGTLNKFYRIQIRFTVSKDIQTFLEERNFIMFDLVLANERINFHSIVLSKQDWTNFKFIQATDLHLADRNDRIYSSIKNWTESSIKKDVDDFLDTFAKKLKLKHKKPPEEKQLTEIKTPLRKRLINPNNQFRKFIKIVNREVLKNNIDFIVITGDIVDYAVLSRYTEKVRKFNEFKYEESNWQVFKNILLNAKGQREDKGVGKGEELLCPIFTTVGNHDFRPYHYDITWGEMYTKIGLNAAEAIALNELFSASPITALVKTTLALKGYLSEINPSLDFSLNLGEFHLIFLNSGSDSFKNFRDLITGHPSVTGLISKQIRFLENLLNHRLNDQANTFLFLHGPPINTGDAKLSINIFEKKGERFIKETPDEFKESLLRKQGQSSKARLDKAFNVKYGTISSNWERLLEFCKDHSILTLTGHTHTKKEFRLEEPGIKTKVYASPPFSLKKIENPAAVFYDDYSDLYTDAESIQKYGPFIVHTPALGLGGYKNPETAGAYREIIVKDGKLSSFKVMYINRKKN
ncbi:MAG: metallophosphoesterase family protein [Promethearchaeota archaeon]